MDQQTKPSKQSPQPSQADGLAYFQALENLQKQSSEQLLGRGVLQSALKHAGEINDRNMTPAAAWYGCNIQAAMRDEPDETVDYIALLFARMLQRMNEDHPWIDEGDVMEEVREMVAFDPTWTVEDFALAFAMMAKGGLEKHNGRPSTTWVRACQIAYNELKFDAREQIAAQAKAKAEADRLTAMDPQWSGHVSRKPRTMAEFLGGKNHLSAADRAELAQRDKERHAKGSRQSVTTHGNSEATTGYATQRLTNWASRMLLNRRRMKLANT